MVKFFKISKVRFLVLTLSLCIILGACHQQSPKQYKDYSSHSGISSIVLNERIINDLEVLGKVWGYVKYHHPVFSKNMYNIDYELFELIPLILECNSAEERNEILVNWINGFGFYKMMREKERQNINLNDSLDYRNLTIDWISDTLLLGKKLSDMLQNLRYAKREGESQYVSFNPLGIPVFERDNLFANIAILDCGLRVLALFRYWNIIEYYFPYKYLTDNDWRTILKTYLPLFVNSSVYSDYLLACYRLSSEICDTHAYSGIFFRQQLGEKMLPIHMRFIKGSLVVIKVLQKEDLKNSELCVGDEIIQIGKVELDSRMQYIRQHTSKSNESVFLRDLAHNLGRTFDNSVEVTYKRGKSTYTTQISTVIVDENKYYSLFNSMVINQPAYEILEDSVGYIRMEKIEKSNAAELSAWICLCRTLIIDMRGYPNDDEFYRLVMSILVPDDTAFVMYLVPMNGMPGIYNRSFGRSLKDYKYYGTKFLGKIVVLVDETTQSSSEFITMLLQVNPNVIVLGSQTAGANGNITRVKLPGVIKLMYSSLGIYYPNGKEVQRIGVSIDTMIIPTIQGLLNGKDELIECALSIMKNEEAFTSKFVERINN